MILYSGPLSMFGAKVQIAVLEKRLDVPVEMVPFNLTDLYSPKHPEVARINPKKQVPVLKDGDVEIYDSTQIFEYLEDIAPTCPLWPADSSLRALARRFELESDEVFFPEVVGLMPAQQARPDAEPVADIVGRVNSFYRLMDTRLAMRPYLAGDFSYADIAFFPAQFFGTFLGAPPDADLQNLAQWRSRMAERASVGDVMGAMAAYLTSQGLPTSL